MLRARRTAVAGLAVIAVLGLAMAQGGRSTAHQAGKPALVRRSARGIPRKLLTPAQIRAAYDLQSLYRQGIDGAGQTIVIVDPFGSPTIKRDLRHFDDAFGLPPPPSLRTIQPAGEVPGFQGTTDRLGAALETSLDVEWAHVIAPAASILLVETPAAEIEGATGFPQIVQAEDYVIRRHLGEVISMSLGATEQTFRSPAALRSLRAAFRLAAAPRYRITVVAASGDAAATGPTYGGESYYTRRVVGWPASDPLVTAVGGTQLDLTARGTRLAPDVAWHDSGGGLSSVFGKPAYQDHVIGAAHRGIPDISMDASCRSATAVYISFIGPRWTPGCGTSLSAPMFAGIVALADQLAGHPLGQINPALYRMGAAHEPGIVDVVSGSNTGTFTQAGRRHTVIGYDARRGYDLVSGLGTVDARYFVPELVSAMGE